ncbi:hypothetical protein H7Y21_03690 [Arenimonas sp.]|nr:hypothetical protein [Candidatus Parcubacteria bacterium]
MLKNKKLSVVVIIVLFIFCLTSPSTAQAALSDKLVAFWNFNEINGTRQDNVHSNNLYEMGGQVLSSIGKVSSAAFFSGSNYFTINDNEELSAGKNKDFTIAGWVNLDETISTQAMVLKFNSEQNQREYGIFYSGNEHHFIFSLSSDGVHNTKLESKSSGQVDPNTWYYVVAWHDSVSNTMNIQVNNGPVDSSTYTGGVYDGTSNFSVGAWNNGSKGLLKGKVDALGFWRRVLSSEERSVLYKSGAGLEYPFTVANSILDTPTPIVPQPIITSTSSLNISTPTVSVDSSKDKEENKKNYSITINSPRTFQVFQRNENNRADIIISGKYLGSPSEIEASFQGEPYTSIDKSPSGGKFSGILKNQRVGQGILKVRFSDQLSINDEKGNIGIGDIFVIAGQSNASGRGEHNQINTSSNFKASIFGNDDKWKELEDPTDSDIDQVDLVSRDTAGGSAWPILATYFLNSQKVPVAFVPTAKGATSINQWQKNYVRSAGNINLYSSMKRRIEAVGGNVKAILFLQGEADASTGMDTVTYRKQMIRFADDVNTDFATPIIAGQIGDMPTTATNNVDQVREAQRMVWNQKSNVFAGPTLYDVPISLKDHVHFVSDSSLQILAERWWAALEAKFYGGSRARGPKIIKLQYNQSESQIVLTFDSNLASNASQLAFRNLNPSGFTVKENNRNVPIKTVTQIDLNKILIDLNTRTTENITVSLGSGHSGQDVNIFRDTSKFKLPAEFFINIKPTIYSGPKIKPAPVSGLPIAAYKKFY